MSGRVSLTICAAPNGVTWREFAKMRLADDLIEVNLRAIAIFMPSDVRQAAGTYRTFQHIKVGVLIVFR